MLKDWTLTDAERSLAVYLATLPPGWVIRYKHLMTVTGRTENWVRTTLRGLRKHGLIYDEQTRTADDREIAYRTVLIRRDRDPRRCSRLTVRSRVDGACCAQ